jgi:hypothetical protein
MSPSATPSTSELIEGVLFYPIALVISATIAPGMLLCIPGLLFVTVLILIPVVAMAIVVLLAAALVAGPVVLVRKIRGSRAVSKPRSRGAVPSTVFGRPLVALSADRSRPHLTPAELR